MAHDHKCRSPAERDEADIVTNIIGNSFVPKSPQLFAYDRDGNLTNDGRWTIVWDGENRPVSFGRQVSPGISTAVSCSYDYAGRRSSKDSLRFIYDGWNLVAVVAVAEVGEPPPLLYSF